MTTSTVKARRKGDPQHYVEGRNGIEWFLDVRPCLLILLIRSGDHLRDHFREIVYTDIMFNTFRYHICFVLFVLIRILSQGAPEANQKVSRSYPAVGGHSVFDFSCGAYNYQVPLFASIIVECMHMSWRIPSWKSSFRLYYRMLHARVIALQMKLWNSNFRSYHCMYICLEKASGIKPEGLLKRSCLRWPLVLTCYVSMSGLHVWSTIMKLKHSFILLYDQYIFHHRSDY